MTNTCVYYDQPKSLKISEEPEADHPPGREQDTPTLEPNAQMMCQIGTVTPVDSQETVSKTAYLKTELVHFCLSVCLFLYLSIHIFVVL